MNLPLMYSATLYRIISIVYWRYETMEKNWNWFISSLFNAMVANKSEWYRFDKHYITHYFPSVSFGQNTYNIGRLNDTPMLIVSTRLDCVRCRKRAIRTSFLSNRNISMSQCYALCFASGAGHRTFAQKRRKSNKTDRDVWRTRTWNGYDLVFSYYKLQTTYYNMRTFCWKNIDVLTCKVARTLANLFFFFFSFLHYVFEFATALKRIKWPPCVYKWQLNKCRERKKSFKNKNKLSNR